MSQYQHRQFAWVIVGSMGAGALVTLAAAGAVREQAALALVLGVILALVAVLFSSLTIEITDKELCWSFGPGLIRKRVALAEVVEARATHIHWWEGWGIHLTSRGWLYNVSGFGAVAVRLRSGKRFLLGTDEAERLARQIEARIQER